MKTPLALDMRVDIWTRTIEAWGRGWCVSMHMPPFTFTRTVSGKGDSVYTMNLHTMQEFMDTLDGHNTSLTELRGV